MKTETLYYKQTYENISKSEIIYLKNYNNIDDGYYKTYGNISSDKITLGLSQTELKHLRNLISLLSDNQYKILNDILVKAKNLGIRISYDDIIMLINMIITPNNSKSDLTTKTPTETEEEKRKREERLERERREKERLEKEAFAKKVIDKFMSDITNKKANQNFRGWVLPNGLLISQYNETQDAHMDKTPRRQDHSSLTKTFMAGLEEFDKDAYDRIQILYDEYLKLYGVHSGDYDESFAVERLGWMQVSVCGTKVIAYRAERWQDRILRPFFMDYGFKYVVQDSGRSYEMEFAYLYDHMDEIMELGLKKRYQRVLK